MKVYQALAAALLAEGTECAFGVMGDGNLSIWAALAESGLPIYSARHEGGAVGMTDGWFRANGKVGVAMVTYGPGLTQAATALTTAARNRSSLVVVTGDLAADDLERLQVLDQRRFIEACGARFVSVSGAEVLQRRMREAFHLARTECVPVVLSIPLDVQDQPATDEPYRPVGEITSAPASIMAAPAVIEELYGLLLTAERPVFVAGRGAVRAGAPSAIVQLADRVGALLATSLPTKGLFRGHPFDLGVCGGYATAPAEKLIAGADLVIGFGAELGYFTTRGGRLVEGARIVRIDTATAVGNPEFATGLHVRADVLELATALRQRLEREGVARQGYRSSTTTCILNELPPAAPPVTDGMDPRALMRQLSAVMPADATITFGLGHFLGFACMYLDLPNSVSCHYAFQFGSIGQALSMGIGVAAGSPQRPNFVIDGDGGSMMSLQELETAARHGIQLVVVICNDAGFGAEVHKLRARELRVDIAQWASPDFVTIVRALGGDGRRVERQEDVAGAIADGLAAGGLFVIDARISPTAINDSFGRAYFGTPNSAPRLGAANALP